MNEASSGFDKRKRMCDFAGKTVVMTCGTGVSGSEIACALAECGAQLVILHSRPASTGRLFLTV